MARDRKRRRRSSSSSSEESEGERRVRRKLKHLREKLAKIERRGTTRHDASDLPSSKNSSANSDSESDDSVDRDICPDEVVASEAQIEATDPGGEGLSLNNVDKSPQADKENDPLPPEILNLLGEEEPEKRNSSEAIHSAIAKRWEGILKQGLSPETSSFLRKKYPPPENCQLVEAPRLNPEVAATMTEQHIKRDARLAELQGLVGSSLAAIGKALSSLFKEGGGGRDAHLIEMLSDAGRMLAEVHHAESESRRNLVSVDINKQFKETLTNVSVDGWLFGENLGDRVKAAKALERSSADLKAIKPKAKLKKSYIHKTSLNARGLPLANQKSARQGRPALQPRYRVEQNKRHYRRSQEGRAQHHSKSGARRY